MTGQLRGNTRVGQVRPWPARPAGLGLNLWGMQALGTTTHETAAHTRAAAVGPHRFHIVEEAQEGQRVLFLRGELDVAAAPMLRARVTELAFQDGVVNLDLAGVEFVDVAGLCALNSLAREARRGRWLLDLRRAPIRVRQLARLTGMQNLAFAA